MVYEYTMGPMPALVERNPWTLAHERYNADWIVEQQVGMVVNNFSNLGEAVAELLSPARYERYRANAAAVRNSAVYEIPESLAGVLEGASCARLRWQECQRGRHECLRHEALVRFV